LFSCRKVGNSPEDSLPQPTNRRPTVPPPTDPDLPPNPPQVPSDRFNLNRFVNAQQNNFARAAAELTNGQKTSCWIWYIFPQTMHARQSQESKFYAIASLEEAQDYLEHPILGPRLKALTWIVISHAPCKIEQIMGSSIDADKFLSSMTLFSLVPGTDPVFQRAMNLFYSERRCRFTIERFGVS
jgi:uncharacterized protein (DUF1810 family)